MLDAEKVRDVRARAGCEAKSNCARMSSFVLPADSAVFGVLQYDTRVGKLLADLIGALEIPALAWRHCALRSGLDLFGATMRLVGSRSRVAQASRRRHRQGWRESRRISPWRRRGAGRPAAGIRRGPWRCSRRGPDRKWRRAPRRCSSRPRGRIEILPPLCRRACESAGLAPAGNARSSAARTKLRSRSTELAACWSGCRR